MSEINTAVGKNSYMQPHHEELVMLVEYDLRSGTYTLRDFRTGETLFSLLTHGMAIERLDAPYETCIALLVTAKRLAYVASKRARQVTSND